MGYSQSCAFVLTSFILLAAAAANPPQGYRSLTVYGAICCSPAGQCVRGSHPISGARAFLYCNRATGGPPALVGSSPTDTKGRFAVTATNLTGLYPIKQSYISCVPIVLVPHNATKCPLLYTDGSKNILVGILGEAHVSLKGQLVVHLIGLGPFFVQILSALIGLAS